MPILRSRIETFVSLSCSVLFFFSLLSPHALATNEEDLSESFDILNGTPVIEFSINETDQSEPAEPADSASEWMVEQPLGTDEEVPFDEENLDDPTKEDGEEGDIAEQRLEDMEKALEELKEAAAEMHETKYQGMAKKFIPIISRFREAIEDTEISWTDEQKTRALQILNEAFDIASTHTADVFSSTGSFITARTALALFDRVSVAGALLLNQSETTRARSLQIYVLVTTQMERLFNLYRNSVAAILQNVVYYSETAAILYRYAEVERAYIIRQSSLVRVSILPVENFYSNYFVRMRAFYANVDPPTYSEGDLFLSRDIALRHVHSALTAFIQATADSLRGTVEENDDRPRRLYEILTQSTQDTVNLLVASQTEGWKELGFILESLGKVTWSFSFSEYELPTGEQIELAMLAFLRANLDTAVTRFLQVPALEIGSYAYRDGLVHYFNTASYLIEYLYPNGAEITLEQSYGLYTLMSNILSHGIAGFSADDEDHFSAPLYREWTQGLDHLIDIAQIIRRKESFSDAIEADRDDAVIRLLSLIWDNFSALALAYQNVDPSDYGEGYAVDENGKIISLSVREQAISSVGRVLWLLCTSFASWDLTDADLAARVAGIRNIARAAYTGHILDYPPETFQAFFL